MAQLNDLLVMGQSSLLGPVNINNNVTINGSITFTNRIIGNGSQLTNLNANAITDGTLPINRGGSGQTTRAAAMNALFSLGGNVITNTTDDTTTNWGALGPGYSFYDVEGQLNNQPQRYGIVINFPSGLGGELFQLWHSQPTGDLYHRGGNHNKPDCWNGATWKKCLDSSNYGSYGTYSVRVSAPSFYANSDVRLKENFEQFIPKKSILDLPIYKFDFIEGLKNQIGCTAQDLQKICPEIVHEDENGYLSIQESKIVYLLIDEVKKLKVRLNELEGKNYAI